MNDLNTIKNTVLLLLKEDKRTRKDDYYLFSKVIELLTVDDEFHKEEIKTFIKVLQHYNIWKMPNTKTILRARQGLQRTHPELTDNETAEKRNKHRKKIKQLAIDGFFDGADISIE